VVFGVSRVYCLYLSRANAHLVAQLLNPFNHLRDSILIHAPSRLADSVDDGEVALQRVQCRYGCLSCAGQSIVYGIPSFKSYVIVTLHSGGDVKITM
jgi:hypothetical protein